MPLIQLHPHPFTSLPSHPSLPQDSSRPSLKSYTTTALHEALNHLHTLPTALKTNPKQRNSPPSSAKVTLLHGWRKPPVSEQNSNSNAEPEFWVARQSEHIDSAMRGSASWAEFVAGLREDHAEHEMEYTPSVAGVERLLEWKGEEIGEVEVQGVLFRDIGVEGESIPFQAHLAIHFGFYHSILECGADIPVQLISSLTPFNHLH